jgi:hypothetical protein
MGKGSSESCCVGGILGVTFFLERPTTVDCQRRKTDQSDERKGDQDQSLTSF